MGKINDRITSGRIALDRALLDWRWWGDDTVVKVWLTILLLANWRDQEWQDMTIKRGSFITNYENLALASNTSVKRVRTAIQKLVKTGEITQKATNKFQLITVEKYEFYQENFGSTGKQTANKGQSTVNQRANKGQQLNNINKDNKGNNNIYGARDTMLQERNTSVTKRNDTPVNRTIPPTLDMVKDYIFENCYNVDPESFLDYYTARDWVLSNGKKMKDWQASVRTWHRNGYNKKSKQDESLPYSNIDW